jgi:hypothetical protein
MYRPFAEEITVALEKHFPEAGCPRNLALVYAAGQGDGKEGQRLEPSGA